MKAAAVALARQGACENIVKISLVEPVHGKGRHVLRGQVLFGHGQQGNADIAAVADVVIEVQVEQGDAMLHLHIDGLRLREADLLVAGSHQFGHHRQFVGKEVGWLQALRVEVQDVPLAGAGGYQLPTLLSHDAEVAVDAQRGQFAHP